ncbi:MAG: hypothetical protein N2Z58_06955 [Fervidobacterium sp.]|nr:hypothetical protein [Fervidobacterium sp.]
MINLDTLNLSYVKDWADYFSTTWYITLPISLFFYFFPNLVEFVSIFGFGWTIGASYVSPSLVKFFKDLELFTTVRPEIMNIVISLLCGIVFYGIYKAAIFAGSFVISFLASLFLLQTFFGNSIEWYILVVIGLIIGIVAGSFASRESSKFVGLFAIIFGSFVISAVGVALLRKYVYRFSDLIYLWSILIVFLVLLFSRMKTFWGKQK